MVYMPWSNTEVQLIIADYFNMLSAELRGNPYSKAEHRRALIPLLNNRSEGSVEFKHQNISAVLIELGQPYIKGYLPRFNYQGILQELVIEYLRHNSGIETHFQYFSDKEVIKPNYGLNFNSIVVTPPIINLASEPENTYGFNPVKINYLEREQNNRRLGLLGEQFVVEYEKWYLLSNRMDKYSEQVRWISKDEGDGAGFDILSKNLDGSDKFIEVKTTKLGKESPFFFTENELVFSKKHSENYNLYRVFNFEDRTKLFTLTGSLDIVCKSKPILFKAFF